MNNVTDILLDSVCRANQALATEGLSPLTWGNASAVDRVAGNIVIKPSGYPYSELQPQLLSVVDLESGKWDSDGPRPSSDTETHRMIYLAIEEIGAIIHTHSPAATAWAQAHQAIPCLGTTHADHFLGPIPVCRELTQEEIATDYTRTTGEAIVHHLQKAATTPLEVPAILLPGHGAFIWGATMEAALENAVALEHVACMAKDTLNINPQAPQLPPHLVEHHYRRKHGPKATYGQF